MEKIRLDWQTNLHFEGRWGDVVTEIDGDGQVGISPVAMLLESLAGCAGADVVDILRKGRQELRGLEVRAFAERRPEPPRRFTRVRLEFVVDGPVDRAKAERAVRLSFETYCSVWHTLRSDLELDWSVILLEERSPPEGAEASR